MLKTVKQFIIIMGITAFMLMQFTSFSSAQTRIFPLPGASEYGNVPAPTAGSAQAQFSELAWGVVMNVRYIIGAVAILLIVVAGMKMVMGQGSEDVYAKQRNSILWACIGLGLVAMAGEFSRIFAVTCPDPGSIPVGEAPIACSQGGFLKDPNSLVRASSLFSQSTKIIITFIKYFIGSVAVLMIVRNAMRMITMGEASDKMTQDKKNITWGIIGLVLIVIADNVISNVFYKLDISRYPSVGGANPGVDAVQGVKEIVGVTNLMVSIVGPLAILMLLIGGIMYVTAAGNDAQAGKAKKIILYSIIGIIIAFGAFAIVSTFITGSFDNVIAPTSIPSPT